MADRRDELRDDIDEQLTLYALDLLDDAEIAAVEQRLREDPAARERLRQLRGAAATLALDLDPIEPSPHLKTRLFDAIHEDAAPSGNQGVASGEDAMSGERAVPTPIETHRRRSFPDGTTRGLPWAIAAVLALALAGSLVWNLSLRSELDDRPDVFSARVAGSGAASGVVGEVVVFEDEESAVVSLAGVPQPEPGNVFQVWLIDGGTPEPSVTFVPNRQGFASIVIPAPVEEYRTLAITIEPAGGSLQPTTEPIIVSDLTGG